MKMLLTKVALAVSLALLPAALHAQSQDVAYGRLTVNFSSSFQSSVAAVGISVTDLNGNALVNGSTTFTGVGGALDVTTAAGELLHTGGYLLTFGSNKVELSSPVIDTTSTSSPVISVLVIVNSHIVSRMPLFTLAAPPGFVTPLPTSAGTVQLAGVLLSVAPQMATELNGLLGANVIPAGLAAGTETQYSVFSSYSGM